MEYEKIKILAIISIIFGLIISIIMGGYANIYYIAGNLLSGAAYFLMFTSFIIIIESLALFVLYPVLYLRLRKKRLTKVEKTGEKIDEIPIKQNRDVQKGVYCQSCGAEIPDKTGGFCSKCGAPIK